MTISAREKNNLDASVTFSKPAVHEFLLELRLGCVPRFTKHIKEKLDS